MEALSGLSQLNSWKGENFSSHLSFMGCCCELIKPRAFKEWQIILEK